MLVVVGKYRKQGIGKKLVETYINKVIEMGGDEVVLETEAVNKVAISFYTSINKKIFTMIFKKSILIYKNLIIYLTYLSY